MKASLLIDGWAVDLKVILWRVFLRHSPVDAANGDLDLHRLKSCSPK